MYSWVRAGDVAAKCLLAGLGGVFIGIVAFMLLNLARDFAGLDVDPMYTYILDNIEYRQTSM
jgi:hypothetical protein